jgi:hypothetical protein
MKNLICLLCFGGLVSCVDKNPFLSTDVTIDGKTANIKKGEIRHEEVYVKTGDGNKKSVAVKYIMNLDVGRQISDGQGHDVFLVATDTTKTNLRKFTTNIMAVEVMVSVLPTFLP